MMISLTTTPTPVWDYNAYWDFIVPIGIVFLILLLSNALRRKVKFIRNSLMPTAIIGGFVGLGLKYLLEWLFGGYAGFPELTAVNELLSVLTYHTIAIGFIALGLKTIDKAKEENVLTGKPLKNGLFIVCNYLMQGILGLVITIGLALIFTEVAPFSGVLLPMGYGQGPGQAFNIGRIFETAAGFVGGTDFGLAISTLGFVSACVGGVIYLAILVKKRKIKRAYIDGVSEPQEGDVYSPEEIPLVESIDKLTVQIALVGVIYLATWLILFGLTALINNSDVAFLINSVKPLLWGFNFIFAIFVTMAFKQILKGLKKAKLMKRTYTNNYMLNRIAGVAFDIMIIASIMAIDLQKLSSGWGLVIALAILGIVGAVATYFYDLYVARRVYKGYENEAFLAFYGMMTGTASTGIALLREVDPNFKTPAANDLVTGSTTAILFGFPILLITGIIFNDGPDHPFGFWLFGCLAIMTVLFLVFHYFLIKKPREKKIKAAKK
ncbi:MAG: hypothetical protein NTV44_03740 [Firmicutes bacterium]|nr:hypothetical protein [Bacillota bacterium]